MATYTSTQSGNFSANSTWGGSGSPSANGDIFNVAYGHTVTLDTAFSISSGFGDSYIYGLLKNDQSDNTELRMNGRLYITKKTRIFFVYNQCKKYNKNI